MKPEVGTRAHLVKFLIRLAYSICVNQIFMNRDGVRMGVGPAARGPRGRQGSVSPDRFERREGSAPPLALQCGGAG